jgi:hypothetical protein
LLFDLATLLGIFTVFISGGQVISDLLAQSDLAR